MRTRRQPTSTYKIENLTYFINGLVAGAAKVRDELQSAPTARTATTNTVSVDDSQSFIPVRGRFADDPTWDDFMRGIEQYRQEMNALESSLE